MKAKFNDYSNINIKSDKLNNCNKKILISKNKDISNLYMSSSLPKTNKTLQKYINKKLNSINKSNKYSENPSKSKNNYKLNQKLKQNIIFKKTKLSPNTNINRKSNNKIIKIKNVNEKIYTKKSISKNKYKYNYEERKKPKENNNSFNIITKRKPKLSTTGSNFLNSASTSGGVSISSNNKLCESIKIVDYQNKNNTTNNNNYSINIDSIQNNNIIQYRNNHRNRFFLEESNAYCKHKINNFNYETGSDDNLNENIIFLKCDNYSSLTFGNSFSYSNSQRSTKRNYNNDEIVNDSNTNRNLTFYYNNTNKYNFVNKLKEENEALKKELQESNDQISLLKYQIKELKEINVKKNSRNIKYPTNLWNKKNIKYEYLENKKLNKSKKIKEFSLGFGTNDKIKFKNHFLEKMNNTVNNSLYGDKIKLINVKRNINLRKKICKKSEDDFPSFSLLDKPCEKITECILNLKI